MKIGDFNLNDKVYIIAEMSANHGNDIKIAKDTIYAAKESGADAVKIQTYTPDTITIDCDNEYFRIKQGTIWDGKTLYELYKEAYTPWDWHEELKKYADNIGITLFSTPFDNSAVDLLESLNVVAYKIASFEITDIPLIKYVASKQKPVIISTGIASLNDISNAVEACKSLGNNNIALLKCTSSYPAKIEDANLKTILNLKETFNVVSGLSDHTLGITVPIVSVAMGARIVEKHFMLDKSVGGPDSIFSLDKNEFKLMVDAVREAEKSIGKVDYSLTEGKLKSRELSRSLFVVKDVREGEKFTSENVRSIRPGYGLPPKYYEEVIGKKANEDLKRGVPLKWSYIK